MGWSRLRFIHRDCDPTLAEDRSLPCTTYLVEYLQDGMTHFDIVMSGKKVEIFDYYWDNYREDLIRFAQTEGRTNPKLWDFKPKGKKK
jgi:hypothetical protein